MSAPNPFRTPIQTSQTLEETDDLPPPYTPHPADEVTLELGPTRPFQPPPQQARRQQQRQRHPRQTSRELSDFARDFYAAGGGLSRSAESLPHQPPPPQPQSQTQNSIPDDGKPTRTPVPGHPLLNNGKTLVYLTGYECYKCHNTGYKSSDPSHPCRKCWEKYSKPYSGPIIYSSWNDGPSNRQRPLPNFRSTTTNSSPSLSRSITSIVNQVRNDLSSRPGNSARRSYSPPPSPVYPQRRSLPPPLPPRPQSSLITAPAIRNTSSTRPRNGPQTPLVVRPGDPRIGGNLCWNCFGSGKTFGFLLSNNTCDLCGGIGRLL